MVEEEQTPFEIAPVGERLRLAREARSMSLDDVASRTRIPIRHLQHIESEDWDALPAITYAIGFTRNYANAVGLDGAEIARELRERIGGPRSRAPATQYYEPADPARVPPRSLAIVAAILALLVVVFLVWRGTLRDQPADVPILDIEATQAPAPAAPPALAPRAAAGQAVTLTATGEVWLRIDDGAAGGAPLFHGSLNPGQLYHVPATAQRPLIRTGRPQHLRVSVGSRDLGPLEPAERLVENVSLRPEDLAARGQSAPPQ